MWMKTRFAQWEVEGQVRERVNGALVECEQGRLAAVAAGRTDVHRIRRYVTALRARLASVALWLDAARHAWFRGAPTSHQDRLAAPAQPRAAADGSPDPLPSSAHRS